MPQVRGLRFALAGLVFVFAAAADAATISLYPSTSDAPTGAVSTPSAALAAGDGAGAGVSSNSSSLTVRGFPGTARGTISAVTAVVRYRTTAPPAATSPDRYRFELALDGATFSHTILADSVANQAAYVEAQLALGALTWTEVAATAIRCATTKLNAPDGYAVDWDVAYLVVNYEPVGTPAPPTFSGVADAYLRVEWPAVAGATSYRVDRAGDAAGTPVGWLEIAAGVTGFDSVGNVHYLDDSGLTASTRYWYRIRAENAYGVGQPSSPAQVLTLAQSAATPGTPGMPAFPSRSDRSVRVTWTKATGAASYTVRRAPDAAGVPGPFADVATGVTAALDASTHYLDDGGLTPGTTYWYEVAGWNSAGLGSPSPRASVTTLPPVPGAPGPLAFSNVRDLTLTLSWSPASGAASYDVFRAPDASGAPGTYARIATGVTRLDGASHVFDDAGPLTPATRYWYRVVGVNATGSGAPADGSVTTSVALATITVADGANPPDSPACPGAPAGTRVDAFTLSATGAADRVTAVTVALSPAGAFAYVAAVEVTDAAGTPYGSAAPASDAVAISLGTGITAPLEPATPATYYVRIVPKGHAAMPPPPGGAYAVAATVAGISSANPTKLVNDAASGTVTIDNLAPARPAWGAVTVSSGSVSLAWVPPADAPFVVLLRRTGGAILDAPVDGQPVGATLGASDVIYAGTGLTIANVAANGSAYHYRLSARDACGNHGGGAALGPIVPPGPAEGDPARWSSKPTVAIVNPTTGAVTTGPFRVQVRVTSPPDASGVPQPIEWVKLTTDGSTTVTAAWRELTRNANFGQAGDVAMYELQLSSLPAATYTLRARARNASGEASSAAIGIRVNDAAGGKKGDGNLLVRDNASRLCSDCHTHQTHGSATAGTVDAGGQRLSKYGAWTTNCRDCHTPHGTPNLFLLRPQITPPAVAAYQPPRDTRIQSDAGYSGAAPGEKPSYANADGTGPCQVCHTRTQGLGGAARFRNGLNDDTHYTSRTERCGDCHNHQSGFRGKTCAECHLGGESELDQASHAAGDGVVARISASEWMKYGHGAPTDPSDPVHGDEYPSGKPRARLDGQGKKLGDRGCAYCHTASTSHDEPFNFFRLANRELGPNGPCLVCHDRSASGFDPDGPSGDAYDLVDGRDAPGGHGSHSAINHTGGFFCWDCHDAHGDVSASGRPLWSMLRRRLVEQSVTSAADPAFGKPDLTQIPSPLTAEIEFDPSVGGTAALDLPDYYAGGLCRNCHDARDPASTGVPGVKWFNKTTADLAAHALSAEDGQSCSSCHIHRTSCGNCHGVAPATGNHRTHLELAEPQMERGSVDHIFATNDAYAYGCGKCHAPGTHGDDRDGHTGTSSDPFPVNVGFDTTVPPASDPASSYQRVGGTLLSPGADGRYWSYTDGTCLNNACHSNGAPVDRPIVYDNSPTWMQNTGRLRCDACHAGAGGTTWSRGHDKHVNAAYGYGCERCHSSVVSSSTGITNKSLHVNGAAEVRFDDVGLVKNLQAGYDASARTCSATYCHSDGTNVAAPGGVSVAWTAIGQAGCDSCHPGDAGLPRTIATFAHGAHVNQRDVLGTNVTCEACHATTVSGDRTLTSIANHVDGEPDVSMVVAGVGASGTYFGGICSNNYCHSAGLSRVAVENEAYAVGWKGGETLDCKGCHGRHSQASFVASPLGEPNYVSAGAGVVKANSHAQHLRGMTCADCHPDTVDALGRPILDGTKHVDGVRDVRMAQGTYDGAVGAKRCSSTACHANGAPQWGGSSPCQECHVGASDRPSWNIEDGVVALISSGEWSTRGHGRPDATMDCLHCHTSSTGHYVSENPYRLANFNATSLTPGGDGWNSNCLVCHATNATSFGGKAASAAARVDAYHYGTKHGDTNDGGRRCWDCHDVHGDGSNARMIGDEIVVDAADPFGLVASRATGVRYTPANPAAPADTDYANAAFTGICNVCHRSTATAPATATAYFNDAVSDFGHSSGQACIACHPHTEPGFVPNLAWAGKGGSCTGCHHGNAYAYLKAGDPKYATTSYVVRKTSADWSLTSRHGGNGGQFMGGAVTDGDCIVCHFEGNLGSDGKAVENGTWHKNRVVDLRDADDNTKSFAYDKFAIHADVERTGGNASSWSSANGAWRTQTSTALDPFCLTCHDSNGAMASCRLGDSRALADCRNDPFGDKAITNEYDQQPRLDAQGRPVITDVRSRVSIYVDLNGDGVMDAPVNRDATGEAPDTNGIEDPPNGVYSRHAIRGQSRSVYTTYATPLGTSSDGGAFFSLFQARNTGYTGLPMLTSMGSDENGPLWNDTSVMGCADCHTVDGANAPANPANPAGTFGNAHGSSSEYLLKNSAGLAASSTWNSTTQENTYVCARCHTGNVYTYSIGRHGGSKSDYVDSVGLLGATNRKGAAGSIFGISCQNCHGGSPWGSIHGTTETFGVGQGGAGGTRRAYRFTNGGALRYYNPNSWVLRESTCYTLSGGDGWSNCTAHTTARGSTRAKQFQRPLRY